MPSCRITDCPKPPVGQGLCSTHYNRAHKSGELVLLRPDRGVFTFERAPLSDTERAYFAGYFGGEGCLQIQRPPKDRRDNHARHWPLRVEFKQTQEHTVLDLHRFYGGSLRVECAEHGRWRPNIKWGVSRTEAVLCFLRDIEPYVREKRAQVELVLRRYKTPMMFAEGEPLYTEMRALKKRSLSLDAVAAHVGRVVEIHDLRVNTKENARG